MKTETILIRPAELSDISTLNRLLASLFQQEDEFTPNIEAQTQGLTEILQHPEMGQILVSCETSRPEQNIIGMVSLLFSISTALGGKVAWLEDMVIMDGYRQQGIGSALIQSAIDKAKHHGCKRITLLTDNHNTEAQIFYGKHGFQASSMQPYRLLLD